MKRTRLYRATLAIALLGLAWGAAAQTVYRVIGPDGKLTFSDKPPISANSGKVTENTSNTASANTGANLPYELRQVVSRFPVTLYTTAECSPCNAGRAMLISRGIPFSERSVTTPEDSATLLRTMGDPALPLLVVGGQRIKGFAQAEWTQTLDAAGYPASSKLPSGYKYASATPLAPAQKPLVVNASENSAPVSPPPEASPAPANPAGIRF